MSAHIMTKQCIHCKKIYTYNPSVGDIGMLCKHCHRPQRQTELPIIPYSRTKQNDSKWLKKPHR